MKKGTWDTACGCTASLSVTMYRVSVDSVLLGEILYQIESLHVWSCNHVGPGGLGGWWRLVVLLWLCAVSVCGCSTLRQYEKNRVRPRMVQNKPAFSRSTKYWTWWNGMNKQVKCAFRNDYSSSHVRRSFMRWKSSITSFFSLNSVVFNGMKIRSNALTNLF